MVDLYEPMSRRTVVGSAIVGVVLAVVGLVLRPVQISAAVVAFLLAFLAFGLSGYGVLDRLVDRLKRSRG